MEAGFTILGVEESHLLFQGIFSPASKSGLIDFRAEKGHSDHPLDIAVCWINADAELSSHTTLE